jgi:four helix bundle protein
MERARQSAMVVKRFQDLAVWQLSRELERRVVAFTAMLPASRDLDYCRQVRRSSSSAARNIAEGFGRFWPAEFARFVRIARGSLEETKDHVEAAFERGYISEPERAELITLGNRALGASTRLAQYLDEAAKTWTSKRGQFRKRRKNPEPKEPEP